MEFSFCFLPYSQIHFPVKTLRNFLTNDWASRAPSGSYRAHTRERALGETMPVSAHLIPPPPPAFCCSLKRKLKSALWSPARAMAIASLHLSLKRKVLPNGPTQAVSSRPFPRLCGSGVGSGPRGRWEMCAGSLPHGCDFYSLRQSRRGRTPAAWKLTGLVHLLSPAARCCSAQERHTLCTLPGIPPLTSSAVHRGVRWGLALEEVAIFWLLPCVNKPWKTTLYKPSSLTEAGSAVKGLCTTLQPPPPPEFSSF